MGVYNIHRGLGLSTGQILICEYRGELVRSTIPTPGVYCNRPLLPRAGPSFTGLGDFGGVFEIRGSFTGSPTERPEAVNRSIASVRPGVLERADVVTPGEDKVPDFVGKVQAAARCAQLQGTQLVYQAARVSSKIFAS